MTPRGGGRRTAGARPVRRRGGHARRPAKPRRQRLRLRRPSLARTAAALGIVLLLALLGAGLTGPWLRIAQVSYAGERFTDQGQLGAVLAPARGAPLLALNTEAIAAELRNLPAVAEARVETLLPDRLEVTVREKEPRFVWQTPARRLVGSADGTLVGEVPSGDLADDLAALPYVNDRRGAAAQLLVGERLPAALVATALHLVALDPARLGSRAARLTVEIDDEYGFILVSSKPAWRAAFGFYGLDPLAGSDDVARQVERQAAALRTLFAAHPEATVSWVDARNPGKVYFRAKG
jgi:cell division protein FtsQ